MRKVFFAAALSALLLASCAAPPARVGGAPDPHAPSVFIVDGRIVVNQEPVYIAPGDRGPIVWQLNDKQYSFPNDGIVIQDAYGKETRQVKDEFPNCHPEENGQRYSCENRHTHPDRYKYTIKVQGGATPPAPLDPWIANG